LIVLGHDVVHTSELPNGNRTPDREITRIAEARDRIVVTKDRDFVDGHLLSAAPRRLLVVSTGNIRNDDLMDLFAGYSYALASAFDDVDFVELDRTILILHGGFDSADVRPVQRPRRRRPPGDRLCDALDQ
jgi:predicted nuclease of predicted toxin-antitoxin system